MRDAEFILVDHEASMRRLKETMERVGAAMAAKDFVEAVSNAYHQVEAERYVIDMHAFFRTCGSYPQFKQALLVAKQTLKLPVSILDIGCGSGYDLEVLREVFSPSEVRVIFCCDISPEMLALASSKADGFPCRFVRGGIEEVLEYGVHDLVVTHSLVHHVPNLTGFFQRLDLVVAPGGGYVTGHEPNRRHWISAECMAVVEKMKRAERRRKGIAKYFVPSRYVSKMARLLRVTKDECLETEVNSILRDHFGLVADLTPQEIRRLVDVHVPDDLPGNFKIGWDGFDWKELQASFLPNYDLVCLGTSGYMGNSNPADLPSRWQKINAGLAQRYPLDGSIFSAFWRKREER